MNGEKDLLNSPTVSYIETHVYQKVWVCNIEEVACRYIAESAAHIDGQRKR